MVCFASQSGLKLFSTDYYFLEVVKYRLHVQAVNTLLLSFVDFLQRG